VDVWAASLIVAQHKPSQKTYFCLVATIQAKRDRVRTAVVSAVATVLPPETAKNRSSLALTGAQLARRVVAGHADATEGVARLSEVAGKRHHYTPAFLLRRFAETTGKRQGLVWRLQLVLHTGLTPNPGSGSYNAAYEKSVTLLGPGAPRPMVYAKWLDFYMHAVWRSHTNGVLEIWYRVDGEQRFRKLYSDVPGGGALIQVRPHPTLLYNTQNGAPGENGKPGLRPEGGFYRANTPWTNEYWWDGMRRRQG
jgi:hypothetical protein